MCQNQVIHRLQAVSHKIRDRNLPCAAAAYQLVSYTTILGVLDKLEWEFLEEGPAGVMAWLAEARGLLRETTTAG